MKYLRCNLAETTVKNHCIRLMLLAVLLLINPFQDVFAARAKQKQPEAMAAGALLPQNRIIGYYGNFHSTRMGVLGEYPPDQMLSMLKQEMRKMSSADPETPTIPAIEYIAVVAQKDPGSDGKYRARMSDYEIQKAIALADRVNGIVILDIQVGLSDLESEIPRLARYLKMPNVMLGIDPEFSMPAGKKPGKVIGTVDARDINFAINYLAKIVQENNLPPKILVVHRFTKRMVTNHHRINLVPEVQVVMDMDGWGPQTLKRDSYRAYIAAEPVQFTGIKLFYKNDLKNNSSGLMTPEQIMKLDPVPMFILFQ